MALRAAPASPRSSSQSAAYHRAHRHGACVLPLGTAYCDDVAVRIVADLGLQVVNFDVLGDAGATYSASQVTEAMLSSTPGSIVLAHVNQPDGDTAEGIAAALPELSRRGFRFVRLSEYLR
jgi:hypothetical protein